jgi:hypothetical protein
MARADEIKRIRQKYRMLGRVLNEQTRRLWAAAEAQAIGWGGVVQVSEATGLSRPRIVRGLRELEKQDGTDPGIGNRIRRPGGGGKRLTDKDITLLPDLDALVDPTTRGDPMSPLRWTCKSTTKLAVELNGQGHKISARAVAGLLKKQGYSLQSNLKTKEGTTHPDRNAQFEHINDLSKTFRTGCAREPSGGFWDSQSRWRTSCFCSASTAARSRPRQMAEGTEV